MSLAGVRGKLDALGRTIDAMDGKSKAVEYVWSVLHIDGTKTIHSGNPASLAKEVVEIQCRDTDGPGSAPRIIINGEELQFGGTA